MLDTITAPIHTGMYTVPTSGHLKLVVQVEFSNVDEAHPHTLSVWVQIGSVCGDVKTITIPPKGTSAFLLFQPMRGLTPGQQQADVNAKADAPDAIAVLNAEIVSQ